MKAHHFLMVVKTYDAPSLEPYRYLIIKHPIVEL